MEIAWGCSAIICTTIAMSFESTHDINYTSIVGFNIVPFSRACGLFSAGVSKSACEI
jgi:hypothetical protein